MEPIADIMFLLLINLQIQLHVLNLHILARYSPYLWKSLQHSKPVLSYRMTHSRIVFFK